MYWHDIPIRVRARGEGPGELSAPLPERFQEAIDAAAMATGLIGSDEYSAALRRGDTQERDGTAREVADAAAAEIAAQHPTIDWRATVARIREARSEERVIEDRGSRIEDSSASLTLSPCHLVTCAGRRLRRRILQAQTQHVAVALEPGEQVALHAIDLGNIGKQMRVALMDSARRQLKRKALDQDDALGWARRQLEGSTQSSARSISATTICSGVAVGWAWATLVARWLETSARAQSIAVLATQLRR